ncbi:hypothetical protein SSTU70S_01587 [Stutzerimonas stutzeri]
MRAAVSELGAGVRTSPGCATADMCRGKDRLQIACLCRFAWLRALGPCLSGRVAQGCLQSRTLARWTVQFSGMISWILDWSGCRAGRGRTRPQRPSASPVRSAARCGSAPRRCPAPAASAGNVQQLLLQLLAALGDHLQHDIQLFLVAGLGVVELDQRLAFGQREADALAAQDQLQRDAILGRVDALLAGGAGRGEHALFFVEADGAGGDVQLVGQIGNAVGLFSHARSRCPVAPATVRGANEG